ncbi:RDD family protein [Lysobacter pythonis]|uniref:RDD family protein n=1 Tax=Solilutibacter pythonis TaxID=2483112 RepID=A0A3M2HS39_9GAMM|nr:RDD family protein [Lysobacter pythonis]RMH88997.1 RDD family protein [Lysobacter pythonis]
MTEDTLPPVLPAAEWFHVDAARQQHGPITTDELMARLARGELRADTLVWKDGMADWLPLATVPELATPPAAPGIDPLPSQAAIMPAGADIDRSDIAYAGFWRRVAANWLDSMIIGVASYALILPLSMMMGLTAASLNQYADAPLMTMLPLMSLVYFLLFGMQAAYFAWMHSRPAQATLGKMAVGIKVCGPEGARIGFWRGFGRYFALLLGCLPLYVGVLMAAFTERKRGLHDMICDTVVVDKWAYTHRPELQKRGLDGVTIAVLVVGAILILLSLVLFGLVIAAIGAGGWH